MHQERRATAAVSPLLPLRADSPRTSHITKSKATEMKIEVIGETGLIAAVTQVSHA
jgi:hypothetical protein